MPNKAGELLAQAKALRDYSEAKGVWLPDDAKKYESILGELDQVKFQAELDNRYKAAAEWVAQPDGKSAVKNAYGREAAPMEGDIPGVTQDSADKSGYELWATDSLGEQKLRALKSGAYKDSFVSYIKNATKHGPDWRNNMKDGATGAAMKVLQEGQDTAGGFWIPPDIRSDLVKKMAATAVIRKNAFAFTVGSDLVTFPKVVYTADDIYTSGVRFAWTAEAPAANISEATNPTAGRITIPVYTATCAVILTRAMLEDNIFDALGFVTGLMGEAFALGEEDAFINSAGAASPEGFLAHPQAAIAHSAGGMYVLNGSTSAPTWGSTVSTALDSTKGLLGLEAALPPQYDKSAKYYFSKATKAAIRALTDLQGRPLWASGDMYPSMANGYQASLLGAPFEQTQLMPTIASNSLSVAYGDMTSYFIPDRVGLSVQVFYELRGLQDEVVLYARKRMGGQLVYPWKLKLLKFAAS